MSGMRNQYASSVDTKAINSGVLPRDSCTLDYTRWSHAGSKLVDTLTNTYLGKSGYEVIRFAFKRLPDQDPLVNGAGRAMPEPDYESEEWKGWGTRLTDERAEEVL